MKRALFIIITTIQVLSINAQGVFTLKGKIDKTPCDSLLILVISEDGSRQEREDTIAAPKGVFNWKLKSDKCRMVYLMARPKGKDKIVGFVKVFATPGETAEINGTIFDYKWSGGKMYTDYQSILDKVKPITKQINDVRGNLSATNKDFIGNVIKAIKSNEYKVYTSFIKSNTDNILSAFLIGTLPTDEADECYKLLSPSLFEGPADLMLDRVKKSILKDRILAKAHDAIKPGKKAPDFTLKDTDGKDLSLSSLKGKYVVLDFWGSWCGWCIKGFPKMKEYYSKYKDKIEILGIACNDTPQRWMKAIKTHQLPWMHVINGKEDNTPALYNVNTFPSKIIINPDGMIEEIFVGESHKFYDYLDEIAK